MIKEQSQKIKSYRSNLCQFVEYHPSYLSQVLHSDPNFNLEQADRLNQFLSHSKLEARYFIYMVELAR